MRKNAANACVNLSSNQPIIVAGPTGVGKSLFAVELANRLGGEILGTDAYQVYSGLEILTAQPEPALLQQVPHHLIGCLPPAEPFDAARFRRRAMETMEEIQSRGHLPILTGGSGLYVKALTHGLAELPPADPDLRAELSALSATELLRRLDELEPTAAQKLDRQNPRRVLRALEIRLQTDRPLAETLGQWESRDTPGYRGLLLVRERAELDQRIADNVQEMFRRGVVEEVRLLPEIGPTAAMTIGLRKIQAHLRGEISEEECIAAITLDTRRYAKRQLTWFRNQFNFSIIDLTGSRDTQHPLAHALQALGIA